MADVPQVKTVKDMAIDNFYTYELCSSASPFIPFYIGKGRGKRMYKHEKLALINNHKNKYLQRKILKILKEGNTIYYHKFNDNVSEEDALFCEETAIATFKGVGVKLCNLTEGGEGASLSEETKRKIGISNIGKHNAPKSLETRRQLSLSHIGKSFSEETKKRMSESRTGHIVTEEAREKSRQKQKGIPKSEETKLKMKEAIRQPLTEEHKKHISIALRKYYGS